MSDYVVCVIHAFIAGVATSFAIAVIPPLAGVAVYSGLLSLAYAIRFALFHPTSDPSG